MSNMSMLISNFIDNETDKLTVSVFLKSHDIKTLFDNLNDLKLSIETYTWMLFLKHLLINFEYEGW
jgi:hypothetical protein